MADFGNQLEGAGEKAEGLAGAFDNLMIKAAGLAGLEEKKIKADQKSFKLQAQQDREKKKALPLHKKMTIQLQQRLKHSTLLNKGLKETIKSMNLLGKTMSGMKKSMGAVGKGIGAIGKAGAIGGLVVGVKFLVDSLLKIDTAMAGLAKQTGLTRVELKGVQAAAEGAYSQFGLIGITLEQTTKEAGNLIQAFGRADQVTKALVKGSLDLQKAYGLGAEAAGTITVALDRSGKSVNDLILKMGEVRKLGGQASLVMRDLATQSAKISFSNERTLDVMIKQATLASQSGTTLERMSAGIKGAFADSEQVQMRMSKIAQVFGESGQEFNKIMGTAREQQKLAMSGEIGRGKLQDRFLKATKQIFYFNEKGVAMMRDGSGAVAENEHLAELIASHTGKTLEDTMAMLKAQTTMAIQAKKKADKDKQFNTELARINQLYKDQQNILEMISNMVGGVFDRIGTAFSKAMNIDDPVNGIRKQIGDLSDWIVIKLNLGDLMKDVEGKGFVGFFEELYETRLKPLFDELGNYLGNAVADGLGNAYAQFVMDSPVLDVMLPDTKKVTEMKELRDLQEALAEGPDSFNRYKMDWSLAPGLTEEQAKAKIETLQKGLGIQTATQIEAAKDQKLAQDKNIAIQKTVRLEEQIESIREGLKIGGTTDKEIQYQNLRIKGIQQEIEELGKLRTANNQLLFTQREVADLVDQNKADRKAGIEREEADAQRGAELQESRRQYAEKNPPKKKALGGFGGPSIVGEAGGEVVASRSALRSGIGIGGKAAAELASIGVPGFQNGFSMAEGRNMGSAVATEGLQGRYGSEEYKKAQVEAAANELAYQQEPMKQFWRDFYEAERNAAAEGEPQGPSLDKQMGNWLKEFWKTNERVIDKQATELLKNQGAGAKEMYKGVFTAMSAWSTGSDSKQALTLGVQAGITEGFKKDGTLNKVFTNLNKSNADLLYAQNGGVEIEKEQLKVDRQAYLKSSDAYRLAVRQYGLTSQQAKDAMDVANSNYDILQEQKGYLQKLEKHSEKSKTLASLQYGVMQGLTTGFEAALLKFAETGNFGAAKEQLMRTGVSQGALSLGSGLFGGDKMAAAQANVSATASGPGDAHLIAQGFENGGVVDTPTLSVVGESGPEVVVPKTDISQVGAAGPGEAGLEGKGAGDSEKEKGEEEGGSAEGIGSAVGELAAGMMGAGGGGGGGDGAIIQLLSQILGVNSQISGGVQGIAPAVAGTTEAVAGNTTALSEIMTVSMEASMAVGEAIGTLLADVGTDLSSRFGTAIKHLSTIDTKVANHPSELQHKLKLTQGAAKGAAKEAAKETGKTALTVPPVPGHMPGLASVNAAMGGGKGGGKGASKAWDKLEGAAKGKYVNSPTLMMVGEEGRGEVVVPTERIRKGLPINAGVARELGSIGVPGFDKGGNTQGKSFSFGASLKKALTSDSAKNFGAGALVGFSNVFKGGGGFGQSAAKGVGAGVEHLMNNKLIHDAIEEIPYVGPLINALNPGKYLAMGVTAGINKVFGLTGGHKGGRKRALKTIEGHIKSRSLFDLGQPSLKKHFRRAVGGKEKVPKQNHYNKLEKHLGTSKLLAMAGVSPELMISLGMGRTSGKPAMDIYKAMNTNLYGDAAGDKYMKAVALPQLADGGIVTKPTTAVIGERGPEMVIPLHEQKATNDAMIKEMKEQNKLMKQMIRTQVETGKTEVRLDGRVIAETTADNFYDIGNGM